jgi:hypothetical protein
MIVVTSFVGNNAPEAAKGMSKAQGGWSQMFEPETQVERTGKNQKT